jgi:signal transduction histidine kinase
MLPRRRFVVILLSLTGMSFVALFALGLRSLNNFEVALARVLRDGARNAAELTAQQIQRDFKSPVFNLLEQIDHPAIKNFDVAAIAETLERRGPQFPMIATFFVWNAASTDEPPSVLFFSISPTPVGRADRANAAAGEEAADRFYRDPALATLLQAQARQQAPLRKNYAFAYLSVEGHTHHAVIHFIYDEAERSRLRGFVGFLADTEHLRRHYFRDLASRWSVTSQRDYPALAFSILDAQGVEVARLGRSLRDEYDAEARFPLLFFDIDLFEPLSPLHSDVHYWTVRTGYEEGQIAALAHRETMPQRWAWLFFGLVAVVGIVLTARATARDMLLAHMKSEFVASVSHDLKTPLAKIQLFADTLQSGRVRSREKAENYYRVISAQARKLSIMIGELLDFSKIESGVREYPLEELDLCAVLRSTLEMFEDELSRGQFTVEIDIPDSEVPVLANGEGLQQLFANLISNALKYSPNERFLQVALSTANGWARIELTDHGIGIPRGEQQKIFGKFYRGKGAVAMAATGSGIGLAIAENVVNAHEGTISVNSVPGQGSTFVVDLPLLTESWGALGEAHTGH